MFDSKTEAKIREYEELIKQKRLEMRNCGRTHRRDTEKYVRKMEKELMTYIRYQQEASLSGQRSAVTEGQTI